MKDLTGSLLGLALQQRGLLSVHVLRGHGSGAVAWHEQTGLNQKMLLRTLRVITTPSASKCAREKLSDCSPLALSLTHFQKVAVRLSKLCLVLSELS